MSAADWWMRPGQPPTGPPLRPGCEGVSGFVYGWVCNCGTALADLDAWTEHAHRQITTPKEGTP